MSAFVIRNPKKKIEKYRRFSIEQVKLLWRQKFNTYSVIMSSVFLGISWNFLSTSKFDIIDRFPILVDVQSSPSGDITFGLDCEWHWIWGRSCLCR